MYGKMKRLNKKEKKVKRLNLGIIKRQIENYKVSHVIGRGKFSQVFLAKNIETDQFVVLKILKPGSQQRMVREVTILKCLAPHDNIQSIHEVLNNPMRNIFTFVLEHYEFDEFENYFRRFNLENLKTYMRLLLQSIDYIHSQGIIHRDLKPLNILYKYDAQKLKVIDFGQAIFYKPKTELSHKVNCRFFKAPELILEYPYYHYSIDIWAVGMIFASIIFQRYPFILSENLFEQFIKTIEIFGSDELLKFHLQYGLKMPEEFNNNEFKKQKFSSFVNENNQHLATNDAISLLSKLLVFDPQKRISAADALKHPFFKQ